MFGAHSNKTSYKWKFPSGAEGQFASIQYKDDVENWQTSEIDALYFDELPHFEESQFWYMMSRLRSTAGVRKRVRAGTNPDGGSWVKRIIAPWVDDKWDGFTYRAEGTTYKAAPAVQGEIRYIARDPEGNVIWVDEDWRYPPEPNGQRPKPKSITFIPASLSDNGKLQAKDPDYVSNLLMQDPVNAARLLRGDWSVMRGNFFVAWGSDPEHTIVAPYVGYLPSHWQPFGGLDANGIAKGAFSLCATDEYGALHVIESLFHEGETPAMFCARVLACLARWGVPRNNCPIAADPAMFSDNSRRDMVGEADIEVYHRAGLNCFEANNNRIHGWSRLFEWLQRPGKFHVWKGYNDKLIEQFPVLKADPLRAGDLVKKDAVDDPHDALRYAAMTRPGPAPLPKDNERIITPGMMEGRHHPPMAGIIPAKKLPHALTSEKLPFALQSDKPDSSTWGNTDYNDGYTVNDF